MPKKVEISRRSAIKALSAFGAPLIIPEGVIGRKGRPGANDRIVTANIGVGGMGVNHIQPDAAALCDVDDNRLAKAVVKATDSTPATYTDFRRVLDRKDIDAVFIATPDHWHGLMTVLACQAGKHVYSEKPTCRTVEEGRAMINAARHYKRVVQIGAQGRSHKNAWYACRYVRNGQLGQVRHVEYWHPDNPVSDTFLKPEKRPATLNWDLWVGPARWQEYSSQLHPANFRWFMDIGGGQIRDRGNHAMNTTFWIMGMDQYTGKVVVNATGAAQTRGAYDVPIGFRVTWNFEKPAWKLTWEQPGTPKMDGLWGATYHGDRDSLVVVKGDGNCEVEEKAKKWQPSNGAFEPYLRPGNDGSNSTPIHEQDFFDCIRSGKKPSSDVEIGVRSCCMCIIANLSWKLGRTLTFDMGTLTFVGDDQANRMLGEPLRFPWGW